MRIFISVLSFFIITAFFGCVDSYNKNNKYVTSDTAQYFPLQSFYAEEMKEVHRQPYFMYKITEKEGKRDSSVIDLPEFDSIAKLFIEKNITDGKVKANYQESIFHDLSTSSYTINYTAANTELPVQTLDILLNEENNKVKRVFIKSITTKGEARIIEQFSWKAGKSLSITRFKKNVDGKSYDEQIYVYWNENIK